MKCIRAAAAVAVAGLIAMPSLAKAQAADETFKFFTSIDSVPALASFDIGWVDPAAGFYLLADRSDRSIDLINTSSKAFGQYFAGNFVGATGNNNTSGPNGLLTLVNTANGNAREIWVGDGPQVQAGCPTQAPWSGKCSATKVLDFNTGVLKKIIITNGLARADELCYDSVDHLILMANDAENIPFVSLISTDTYQVLGVLTLPQATNGIEQCSWDPAQNLFLLNLPEVNGPGNDTKPGAVLVIVPRTLQVLGQYNVDITHCAGPQGMALGPDDQLLLGCNAPSPSGIQSSVIINKRVGTEIAIAWGLGGADQVWFNPGDNHYAITGASCTAKGCLSGTIQQLGIVDAVALTLDQVIPVPKTPGVSAHSVAMDPVSNQLYLPNGGRIDIYASSGSDADDLTH